MRVAALRIKQCKAASPFEKVRRQEWVGEQPSIDLGPVMESPQIIPGHHSPVRSMWAEGHGLTYQAFQGLEEARSHPEAAMVMEADSGGQILVTCPVRFVTTSEDALNQLLCDLESIAWGTGGLAEGDRPYDAEAYYEVLPVGSGVGGGMGGGLVIDGVWVHEELEAKGLKAQIEAVIVGRQPRLDGIRLRLLGPGPV